MEDDQKLRRKPGSRLDDEADRAEYDRLVKYFHEEEQRANLKNLLFEQASFGKSTDATDR